MTLRERIEEEIRDLIGHYHSDDSTLVNAGHEAQRLMGICATMPLKPPLPTRPSLNTRGSGRWWRESAPIWRPMRIGIHMPSQFLEHDYTDLIGVSHGGYRRQSLYYQTMVDDTLGVRR